MIGQHKTYTNHFPNLFSSECESHNLSVFNEMIGPCIENSAGFNYLIKSSDTFQWVLVPLKNRDIKLFVSVKSTHAVCASNQNVISAGDGKYKDGVLTLNNRTGHYRVDFESIKHSMANWHSLDIKFDSVICEDYLKDVKAVKENTEKSILAIKAMRNRAFNERLMRRKVDTECL